MKQQKCNTKYIQFWISTLPKYQSTGLPCTAMCDGKPALIDSDAAMQTRRNANSDRDRLSERASLEDDAIVGSHGNLNHESAAEMTAPLAQVRGNRNVGFTGWKEAQQTDDVAGQYLFAGNLLLPAPRLMGQVNGITS